jgi:hypothetical protein
MARFPADDVLPTPPFLAYAVTMCMANLLAT